MNDGARSCLGVLFLFASIVLAAAAFFGGWIGWELRAGAILGVGAFAFFFVLAIYMFVTIKDYSWLTVTIPSVLGAACTMLPDLIIGQGDDIFALIVGALLSLLIAYRKGKLPIDE